MPVLDTILLVDDDETTNYLHTRLLNRLGVAEKIAVATNGDEALQYLVTHCQTKSNPIPECPRLIFLDIKMPVMDGIEFLQHFEKIRLDLEPDIHVVVLSSSVNPFDTERLKQFPVVKHHFVKPLSEDIIRRALQQFDTAAEG